jgi:hypothetical protein
MCEREPYGEFGYRKDMRQWKRQSQILRVAVAALAIGIAALFAWVVGL